jgi:hypothetical protein
MPTILISLHQEPSRIGEAMQMDTVLHLELLQSGNKDRQALTMLRLDLIQTGKAMETSTMLLMDLHQTAKAIETSTMVQLDHTQISKAMATVITLRLGLSQINEVTTGPHITVTRHRQLPPHIPTLRLPEMSARCPLRHITTTEVTINSRPVHMAVRGRQITRSRHVMTNSHPDLTRARGQQTIGRPRVTTNLHPARMEARGQRIIRRPRTQHTTRHQ